MEKSRSLSIAVRGLFVSAFLSTVFGVANASAFTVTYKTYGGKFADGSRANIVEYDNNKNIVSGEYKEPTILNSCGDKIFTGWFTDEAMKHQYYLRDNNTDVTVYAGFNKYSLCYSNINAGQKVNIWKNGNYKIELWGAQGGGTGGKGAYTSGNLYLDNNSQLYVFVGGKGEDGFIRNANKTPLGGYNGGGLGSYGYDGKEPNGGGGGGATDIRLVDGEWNDSISLASRIMVASGGAGITSWQKPSSVPSGGSLIGFDGNLVGGSSTVPVGLKGTQTIGGKSGASSGSFSGKSFSEGCTDGGFGFGGNGCRYNGSGAGAGYYGGGGGSWIFNTVSTGGTGSSFISGYTGAVAITSESDLTPRLDSNGQQCDDGTTDNLCSVHYSGIVFSNPSMKAGNETMPDKTLNNTTMIGNSGDGYSRFGTEEENFHTVTFKHAGEDDFTVYVIDGEKVVRPNIYLTADTGYTLHSWEINGTTTEWNFDDPVTEDLVLESYASMDIYAISYNLGIGSLSEPNPATYTVETDDITLKNPTKDYYDFIGWSGTDLSGKRNTSVTIAKGSTGNRSYEANYTAIPYTITYNLDGGTNNANNPAAYTYESNEINIVAPTREGYTFTGWSGTDLTGEDNMTITIPIESHGNREYTAHWSINQYTATFDVNGGTTIDPSTITSDYGVAFGTLPATSRTGYDFDGWYTEQTGGTKISDTTTMPAEDHTYYAHWTIQTFNISYDLNGGELAQGASNPDTYTYESADINLAKPSREGYTFLGWSGTDLTNNTEDVTIAHNSLGDRSYRAEFQINEYTATFDANAGETANPETITKNYNEELGNLPETSRLGYTFLGWFTDATAGDEITDATKMPAGDVTYYAHWEIITYTIEYDLGGEDMDTPPANDASNPTSYTVEDADITLKAATSGDTWHYFVGWALDRDSEGGLSDNFVIDTAEAKNIKVYAIFQANPYTVTLNPDNGDDEIVKTVRGDQEIGELPTPERAGYEFLGWFVGDKQIDEHFHPRGDSIAVARWEEIPTVPDTGANSTPNTGDAIMNHIVTFAVCAFALFIVVVLRKRKAKNEA